MKPDFNLQDVHKYFSAQCFNRAWDFIDKPVRKPGEDEQMLQLSLASLWHWTQREDLTPTNLSIGYWQVSRVYALMRQPDLARRYGNLCLQAAKQEGVPPFFLGYAYEALARAENADGKLDDAEKYLVEAHQIAAALTNQKEKKQLLADLSTIR